MLPVKKKTKYRAMVETALVLFTLDEERKSAANDATCSFAKELCIPGVDPKVVQQIAVQTIKQLQYHQVTRQILLEKNRPHMSSATALMESGSLAKGVPRHF